MFRWRHCSSIGKLFKDGNEGDYETRECYKSGVTSVYLRRPFNNYNTVPYHTGRHLSNDNY
jgi:hypothetical protein